MPNLNGADAWLDRAKEHLKDLKTLCDSLAEAGCNAMIDSLRFENIDGMTSFVYTQPTTQVGPFAQILIGESVQALRRSLDYLVYEIAWQDSNAEQQGTQFPIDHNEKAFDGRRQSKRFLPGVNDKHVAAIKLLQPFQSTNQTKWTKTLANLSNPDKHKHLTVAKSKHKGLPSVWTRAANTADNGLDRTSPNSFTVFWNIVDSVPQHMHMEFDVSTFVALETGERLIEVLDQLKMEVAGVLEDFRPCFEGKCHH